MTLKFIKILTFVLLLLTPYVSRAETHISSDDIQQDWIWTKEGSPYILEEPIYIPAGYILNISEGAEVLSASNENGESSNSLTAEGTLNINGTEENPAKFSNLDSLYFVQGNSSIRYAKFIATGLDFFNSTSTIENTVIEGAFSAVAARGSKINILKSTFKDNSYGINSNYLGPIFQVREFSKGIGGIGNALEEIDDIILDPKQNKITIHDSSLIGNTAFDISNQAQNPINASDNWWGSDEDPSEKVRGPVNVTPWLDEDPNVSTGCCSSVLFLPGTQASRLYKGNNMLWEPNRNDDVRKLSMNAQGVSIDPSILTKDIISTALGTKNIYKGFIESMDDLVSKGSINEWLPAPYDWRKGVYDIADSALVEKVKRLAEDSKTGKVIIIAHSNGGLVAKALMKKLEEEDKSNLIEKSIFVAVPELGTPQAILSMLHGDNQSIAGGLILSENTARIFSQNLPGAYGLLPTQKFFEKNTITVISDLFSGLTNKSASSYQSMKNFLLNGAFSKASSTDINTPLKLNPYLFPANESYHSIADIWKPASTTKTLSIFGWGMPTSKSIVYEKDAHCKLNIIGCDISMFRTVTLAGDGTVMTASNSDRADETIFFNLKKLKQDSKKEIKHADILESELIQNFLADAITEESSDTSFEKYFTTTEPVDEDKWLYIRVYSPVDIHVYDKAGNHTGLLENPVMGEDMEDYETNIPSSIYDGWGRTKQVILPYDQEYEIVLNGTGNGVFSIEAEVVQSDKVLATAMFSEMSVTPAMNADFAVATSTIAFASSTVIYIDADGDGASETLHNSDQFLKAEKKDRKHPKKIKKIIKKLLKHRLLNYKRN